MATADPVSVTHVTHNAGNQRAGRVKVYRTSARNSAVLAGVATAKSFPILPIRVLVLSFAPALMACATSSGLLSSSGVLSVYFRTVASAA